MSQSLFFYFPTQTKKKQTKQSFRNRKKPLCIEKKRKRLRTKVNKINFNSNFFFFNNSFFYFENKYVVSSLGFGVAQTSRTTNSLVFFSMMEKNLGFDFLPKLSFCEPLPFRNQNHEKVAEMFFCSSHILAKISKKKKKSKPLTTKLFLIHFWFSYFFFLNKNFTFVCSFSFEKKRPFLCFVHKFRRKSGKKKEEL